MNIRAKKSIFGRVSGKKSLVVHCQPMLLMLGLKKKKLIFLLANECLFVRQLFRLNQLTYFGS
jgi:hypothetical protein